MQGKIAILIRRVGQLEHLALQTANPDELAAQTLAQELGFDALVIRLPEKRSERILLARSLKAKNWSAARIARVLKICERTAQRWCLRPATK